MDPMVIAMIASAVLGYGKQNEQQQNYKTQMGIEAQKEKYGSLTGQQGQNLQRPSTIDPMLQSLVMGAMMGQSLKKGQGPDGDPGGPGVPNNPWPSAQKPGPSVALNGSTPALSASPYSGGGNMTPANSPDMSMMFPWLMESAGGAPAKG